MDKAYLTVPGARAGLIGPCDYLCPILLALWSNGSIQLKLAVVCTLVSSMRLTLLVPFFWLSNTTWVDDRDKARHFRVGLAMVSSLPREYGGYSITLWTISWNFTLKPSVLVHRDTITVCNIEYYVCRRLFSIFHQFCVDATNGPGNFLSGGSNRQRTKNTNYMMTTWAPGAWFT